MFILPPPQTPSPLPETLWLPAPERPHLPVDELHIWRTRLEEPEEEDCPVSRDRARKLRAALFRNDVLKRYAEPEGALRAIAGPACGLRVVAAQCDHMALIAVSRNVRGMGLDIERVREDIPFEEMAYGFLDVRAQWALRVTRSQQEKAWKFFQFWTSNEACAQAHPSSQSANACQVREFSPEADFIAALAVEGGPEAEVLYWDRQCLIRNDE